MARRNFDKVFKIVAVKLFHKDGMSVSEMPKELYEIKNVHKKT